MGCGDPLSGVVLQHVHVDYIITIEIKWSVIILKYQRYTLDLFRNSKATKASMKKDVNLQ